MHRTKETKAKKEHNVRRLYSLKLFGWLTLNELDKSDQHCAEFLVPYSTFCTFQRRQKWFTGKRDVYFVFLFLQSGFVPLSECFVYAVQGSAGDAERYMAMAKDTIEQLKMYAMDLKQLGHPNDNVVRT